MENKKISLVGYTGFVGSNIARNGSFDGLYNTGNISCAYGTKPDILIYAGLRAEKYIANKYPQKDMDSIHQAIENIKKIDPGKLVLISTIDVYDSFHDVDETTLPDTQHLLPYGKNRLFLEQWVEEHFDDYCIIRLPGLFGQNLKKNFIYDFIYRIPFKLTAEKFDDLCKTDDAIQKYYIPGADGFYQCKTLSPAEAADLRIVLEHTKFSALNFTDSRGIYQFYNLDYLWSHINLCLEHQLKKVNMATEPISIDELYTYLTGGHFVNHIVSEPPTYNFKTCHADLFHGENGYIFNKECVLADIKNFVHTQEETR